MNCCRQPHNHSPPPENLKSGSGAFAKARPTDRRDPSSCRMIYPATRQKNIFSNPLRTLAEAGLPTGFRHQNHYHQKTK